MNTGYRIRTAAAVAVVLAGLAAASPVAAWPWEHKEAGPKIPRWAALKFGVVNARAGPDEASRILFVYRSRGLPVQILAETREWKRVCDIDHTLAWVKSTAISEHPTVMRTLAAPLPLRAAPAPGARVTAIMAGRSIAELQGEHGPWRKVKAGGRSGWLLAGEVWGTDNRPQCR